MALYRHNLPHLGADIFACYTGMDTEILFRDGIDLPGFASYPLLLNPQHKNLIRNYYCQLAELAREQNVGLILDSVTWVANRDRGAALGFTPYDLKHFNMAAIDLLVDVRQKMGDLPTVLSGQVGPRGDGYTADDRMTTEQAEHYHAEQIQVYSQTEVDFISGFTLCYPEEASGIVRAATKYKLPVAISFTVETDGRLPTGMSVKDAIEQVDDETYGKAIYFLINCAHPEHLLNTFSDGVWLQRLRGVVVNASRCSHAELNDSETLDDGDPNELGMQVAKLRQQFPHFTILGGCCGSNLRHMKRILEQAKVA
ncbi:homocysteine S-methyltransferase family protein [Neiella marina]|uniref:Homocysteine S-methyltransferase family protein n=1 Tax=Neiella holothuriorum TaxID=2870530 RepID=A0ABS7EEE7_9GAMM|nr:homocysteine S-methyltransferase family protein [Neiella holothuriorum]MBW8190181.1 homocysteine S-methyltransferase family protein [Neiella holothuriorum]